MAKPPKRRGKIPCQRSTMRRSTNSFRSRNRGPGKPAKGRGKDPFQPLSKGGAHQLFQESKGGPRRVGETANVWVVEGVATYFETLTEHDDAKMGLYYTVGELSAGRLPKAR